MKDQMNTSEGSSLNEQKRHSNYGEPKTKSDFINSNKFEDINSEFEKLNNEFTEENENKENPFPVDILPYPFRELIIECSKSLNFPSDYTGTAILSAISTTIGKSAKVKVKESWFEFPSFYIAQIGNPGAAKSHSLELMFKPFQEIDNSSIKKFKNEFEEFESLQAVSKKNRKSQPGNIKPVLVKTVLNNFTPEILHQRLADNDRGCVVVSDELATFLEGMNNYSKGDQTTIYLSFWSSKPTSIDRVKSPIPLWLPQPFINIIGGLQPRVIPKLFPAGKSDNGFIQRFLFAFPEFSEKQPINDIELNETLLKDYSEWIYNYRQSNPIIVDEESGHSKPKICFWSPEAKIFFYDWHKEHIKQVNDNADSLKGEVLSKFDIHFVRLALTLQIMNDNKTNQISLKAVQGAAKLCIYFQRNIMKVLDILQSSNPSIMLTNDKQNLYNALPDRFTTAEAISIGREVESRGGNYFDEKAVDRFLKNQNLFKKLAHGDYEKKFKS